jgi:MFS family permease
MVATERRKWLALALLSAVQFMVVLDIAIVNVALPSIKIDLGFSQQNLQWVISAYALVFGGFLLLGGRAADLLGRRRLFLIGVVVFTVASLLAGLAWSEGSLIGARAVQGLGAAIISPAALSILSTSRSVSGVPSAASAPQRACSSAACSPRRSAGRGSSSSTFRSAQRRSCSHLASCARAGTRASRRSTFRARYS